MDLIHKETARLAYKNHETGIALEDLNVKGMVRNKKLARAIHDAAWGKFVTILAYKCEWVGKTLMKAGRFDPSSKVCSCCDHKMESMPLKIRQWLCPSCGSYHDRDINAAINIAHYALVKELAELSGPDSGIKRPSISNHTAFMHGDKNLSAQVG